ncbi:TFIIH basal transcription factor complex p47 subunit [Ceratocystis platani]|uniref:TFIIH basal transcription factor complex p47 subunit n=1 Tax=Ceratocystis fimbriata f. sp. platani TaxID=88771 RepID=A0A0F8AZW2_CERFI|nr:TFIIH basal transcription factor complex p47 subunit [Ceratocystis platani]
MADSDGEISDDNGKRKLSKNGARNGGDRKRGAWEEVNRSWDTVVEDEQGGLSLAEVLEAEKRRRLMRDTTPLQRGIIRHLMLVLDMSFAMAEKDMLPSRYRLVFSYAADFVKEYFEQNPISQMGIIGMRDGVGLAANSNTPSHGTREVLVIYGALLSSDPGDIQDTVANLITDRIRVSIVGLAAQVAICAELCQRTNAGDKSQYNIALDEGHLRDLFLAATTPPVTRTAEQAAPSLLMMGFPSRTVAAGSANAVAYCGCHNKLFREGYMCTRCGCRVCRLPASCPGCGLTLILSTHLARSYHHLFPLKNFVEVSWADAARSVSCYACQTPFPRKPNAIDTTASGNSNGNANGAANDSTASANGQAHQNTAPESGSVVAGHKEQTKRTELKGVSESGRYACILWRYTGGCSTFADTGEW